MVNRPATPAADRREQPRSTVVHDGVLGAVKLNPFGDLHTLQHLSARLARGMRGVFEPLLRNELRAWAEPLVVQRFADYRAERPDALTAWLPLGMGERNALCVFDGAFVLKLLDLFFGGTGAAPMVMPTEFSPAAEAMVERLGAMIAGPLTVAWEPVVRVDFTIGRCEANAAMLNDVDGDDAMIITRFGLAAGDADPIHIDLVYPVTTLKPHGTALTAKVLAKSVDKDQQWQNALTRATMGVRFPVRSVLAEPRISLARLMDLAVGDVIPIHFSNDVPVMVGGDRFATGTVGTSNGHAAIQLNSLISIEGSHP